MATKWPISKAEFERACRVIPGGVNSPARAYGAVGGHPLVMQRGRGARITDIDGNEYIDYVGSWGPMILGHCHPAVIEAIERTVRDGTSFGAPTRIESELAELIIEAFPSIDRVRMTSSGTEAAMSAIRVARGFTGRTKIVKFAGCYHGHVDSLLVQAGSAATTLGVPSSPGVPPGCTNDTIVLPYNNVGQVSEVFRRQPDEIAAVILEPIAANMGVVPPADGFLEALRDQTAQHGSVLIFDEVITGFRVAHGGAQELLAVRPDLTILGKIVGGGMPVGAYGGRADIMAHVSPAGPVFQAGTLSGNPVAMAAGAATLRELKKSPPYDELDLLCGRLADGLVHAAAQASMPHYIGRVGSLITFFFNPGPVIEYASATRSDTKAFARFFWRMIEQGVYLPCSQFEALFLSTTHSKADIDATITAAKNAFETRVR